MSIRENARGDVLRHCDHFIRQSERLLELLHAGKEGLSQLVSSTTPQSSIENPSSDTFFQTAGNAAYSRSCLNRLVAASDAIGAPLSAALSRVDGDQFVKAFRCGLSSGAFACRFGV